MEKRKKLKKSNRLSVFTGILMAVLIIYSAILLGLLLWAVLTSFRSVSDFDRSPYGFPTKFADNFSYVFSKFKRTVSNPYAQGNMVVSMWMMLFYAFAYALGAAFFNTATICVTSYVCARFPNRFTKLIHTIVVVVMIIPIVGNLPSELRMARAFGLYNSIWGLWLMKANFLGLYFLVFYNVYRKVPESFVEAAKIDGGNNFQIFFRIMLPITRTMFGTIMLINFITFWNDYQTPLIYMPSFPTIAVGVYYITRSNDNGLDSIPRRMATTVIMLIPILVLFSVFSNKLLGNLTIGGLKE